MASYSQTKYTCDRCGKKLKTYSNHINIVTSNSEENTSWSRLHVQINHRWGAHNDFEESDADLCKTCSVALLEDALKRVQKNERMSAGVETIDTLGFDQPF